MAYRATSGRDLPQPSFSGAGEAFERPDEPTIPSLPETDLAELAAKFAAPTGPGLSPDLAVDLALQMVLHEIVEHACAATTATGAAIALYHDGELVCRASHGLTAPPLGSRLDMGVGLSGECLRTQQIQLCNDVQTDLRVDFEACSQLGVHSIVVLPLSRAGEIVGIFEVLSSRPSAFGERDINLLEELSTRILKNLDWASQPSIAAVTESPPSGTDGVPDAQLTEASRVDDGRRWTDVATWALAILVLACATWLSVRVVQHFTSLNSAAHRPPAKFRSSTTGANTSTNAPSGRNEAAVASETSSRASAATSSPAVRDRPEEPRRGRARSRAQDGGLLVYENGREVFHMPPSSQDAEPAAETSVVPASSVQPQETLELSPSAAEAGLIHRVEPEYPEEARLGGIQGPVVLEVHIRPDGTVEQLKVVSGSPVLADAAMTAVKQWRFKPRQVNGQPAEMQTTVTLNFRLPS